MELLAPAGNFQCLKAAVACGANAVYLGMEKYGARASACNFDSENLLHAVEFAHLHGVKVYVTVNTVIKDGEIQDAIEHALEARKAGADALIVQDIGFICELKKRAPDIVLHASTQMGISNAYGARFAEKLGITRIVAARETLCEDIRDIKNKTGLEIEFFCHGALCVAYSGNCYYSSLVSGCSGNRGKCLQLCRKKYFKGNDSGYFLSAKDICLVDKVAVLRDAGVDSLKIEGRMRTPEYVAETVSVYRKAIDGVSTESDLDRLKRVFNRGDYCKAYLLSPTENVIYSKVQNNIGVEAGTVAWVNAGKAKINANIELCAGDGVKYLRNGYEIGGGLIDGNPTGFRGEVKRGDEVRLTSSRNLESEIEKLNTNIPVSACVSLDIAKGAAITLSCAGATVTACGKDGVVKAQNKPLGEADIKKAVGLLGETDFALRDIVVNSEENIFYPASLIKEMRKRAVEELRKKLLDEFSSKRVSRNNSFEIPKINWLQCKPSAVFVQAANSEMLSSIKFDYDYVVLSPRDYGDFDKIASECKRLGEKAVLNLPVIVRGGDKEILCKLKALPWKAVVANNVSHFELFDGFSFIGGTGLNHINASFGGTFVGSIEREKLGDSLTYAFGKPPLMHFAHCPRRSEGKDCKGCSGYDIRMKDDKGACVRFCRVKEKYCYGVLVPELPINNISVANSGGMLLDFTYATAQEIEAVNMQMLTGREYSLACTHGNFNKKLQ